MTFMRALAYREAEMECGPPEGDDLLCPHCGAVADEAIDGSVECQAGCRTCAADCDLEAAPGSAFCPDCGVV